MPSRTAKVASFAAILWSSRAIAGNSTLSNTNNSTRLVSCRLCPGSNATPGDLEARFQPFGGSQVLTCRQVFENGTVQLSSSDCDALHQWGSTLCLCNSDSNSTNSLSSNNCSLCEDGSSLSKATYEGLPSKICAQLQVEAGRDDPSHCATWQKTIGVYCKCNNSLVARNACRLCGQFPLPDPLLQANRTNSSLALTGVARLSTVGSMSCGELEFRANLPDSNCNAFQQRYGDECCQNLIIPTMAPKSGGLPRLSIQQFSLGIMSAVLLTIFFYRY